MKKTAKRALSFLLTLVMLLSTMSVGLGSIMAFAASVTIDHNHKAVIAVPETVYMTPSTGASTVGKYYVNNTVTAGSYELQLEANAANTKGYVQFYIPGAVKFQVAVNTVTSGIGDIVLAGAGATSGSYENTSFDVDSNGYFNFTEGGIYINGTGLNAGQTALAEWVFTVTMNDGSVRTYYAYSTLYAPYINPVGSAILLEGRYYSNNKLFASSMAWVSGVHGFTNDPAANYYARTDTMVPLITAIGNGDSEDNPDTNWISASAGSNTLSTATFRYNKVTGSSGKLGAIGVYRSPVANVTIDTSRYNNFNQIPNLTVGFNFTDKENAGETYWYVSDYTSGDMTYMTDYSKIDSRNNVNTQAANYYDKTGATPFAGSTSSQSSVNNGAEYNGTWNRSVITTSTSNTYIFKTGAYTYRSYLTGKGSSYSVNYIQVKGTNVDKAALRKLVLEGSSLDSRNYTSASWEAYRTELRAAAQRLGNPTATDVSTSNLTTKRDALQTTVTLNANGGSIGTTSFNATVGNAATYNYNVASYTPSRTGYTFKGWATSASAASGSTSSVTAGLMPTLYATWEINKYSVVFDNLINFAAWNKTTASNATISDVTDNGFTLTSNAGVGEGTSTSPFFPVTPGKQYRIDIDFTGTAWDVYIFFCDANGSWVDFADGASNRYSYGGTTGVPVDNAIFTAPNKAEVVKAQIRVDANGSNNTVRFENIRVYEVGTVEDGVSYENSKTVTYNSTYGTLPTPTRDGYEFLGWYKADGTMLNASDTVNITDTLYVTSQWKKSGYTITWKVDGQQDVTTVVEAGKTPVYPNGTPTKAATAQYTYTFTGWSPSLVAATADTTYTAQFSQTTNKYKVTWIVDGKTAKEEYVEYGQTPAFGSTPTKAADAQYTYTFTGWDTTPAAVTKDVTYTAQFSTTTQTYTVEWVINGQVVETDTVEYGKVPTYDGAEPTKAPNAQYSYTFDKWSPAIAAVTTHARYEATFTETLNKYTVNWVVDNEIYHTEQVEYGTKPTLPENPTKEADAQYTYTFKEWSPTVTNVTGDVNYTAVFDKTVNKYTVTWVDENGTTVLYSADFDYGSMPVYGTANPTKAATAQYTYTFDGWDREYDAVTEATTYTAKYKATVNEYTIEFVNEDGTVLQTGKVAYGETPAYTGATPTKAATAQYTYVFTGWDPEIADVTKDATYTAQFESTTNVYTVTWVNYDGTELEVDENVPYGTTPKYDGATPTKPQTDKYNYTFADKWSPEVDEVTGDVTYTAQFNETVRKYTVTWMANGQPIYQDEVEYDTVPVYNEAVYGTPSKAADAQYTYTFKDWSPAVVAVTGPATYVAEFNETVNTYTVTWVDEDGTELEKDENVPYGATPSYDGTTPSKKADAQYTYTFDKWSPEIATVTGDATYKATYSSTVNTYTVTWKNDNGTVLETDVKVPYGETPSFDQADPTKAATAEFTYTFAGWDPVVSDVTGDVTYTATYTAEKNKYTITWIIDGKEETTLVEYGAMPSHADPEKAADAQYTYTFAGWDPEVVAVTGDATYTAQFSSTVNKYTVTWIIDGKTETETYEYGATPAHATPTKEADAQYTYTFKEWSPAIATVTGDATYTAQFSSTVNKYTVTWVIDGKETTEEYEYGATPSHVNPTKAADAQYTYTFKEWSPAVEKVTKDAAYTAVFDKTVNEYTITWIVDGEETTTTVAYGETPDFGSTPTKEATAEFSYTFKEWTPAVVAVTGEATYEAVFTATTNTYTVTWVDEDGTVLETDEDVPYGATPEFNQANPTKEQDAQYTYAFAGWAPSVSTVTGNVEYKATYSSTVRSYEIKWVVDGNTVRTDILEYGQTPVFGEAPTKAADAEFTYTFAGWDNEVVAVTGEATYTAKFESTRRSYTITWKNDDGSVIDTTTVEYGTVPTHADAVKAETPEFTYTFAGWTPAVVAVTGETTYTATFTPVTKSYKVTWVDEDGTTELYTEDVLVGATIPTKEVPYKDGFIGVWGSYPATMPTNDIIIKAEYFEDGIKVNWVIDDTTTHQTAVRRGDTITPEKAWETKAPSVSTVYTFVGWSETKGGAIVSTFPTVTAADTEDKTYYAVFTESAREYTITWIIDGKSETTSVAYGSTPTHADPTKAADKQYTYTFTNWSPAIAPVTGDATYTAQFDSTVNKYTVTWIVDGVPVKTEDVAYGTVPTFGTDPTKAGNAQYTYTFAGWSPAVTAVTDKATYTATFNATVNKYTVTWVDDNGTVLETDTGVEFGTKPSFDKAEPTKAATAQYTYTFAGWEGFTSETTVTGDVTFKATYTSTVNNYTVTWVIDGKEETETYEYGAMPSHTDPAKAADAQYTYTFKEWSPAIVKVEKDATYTAVFDKTVNEYTITWIVDGEETTTTVAYGETPDFGSTPTKAADVQYTYTFAGWDKTIATVTGDATYTAKFDKTLNKYTVTWVIDGKETTEVYEYGATPSHADPVKAADAQYTYTFAGWDKELATVTGDVTYTAKFNATVNTYTVTWNIDGAETTETYEYGAKPSYKGATPTREATAQYTYTFAGWNGLTAETTVKGDVTFTANFSSVVNEYTITWKNADGTTIKSESVAYGATPSYVGETPVKAGDAQFSYVFTGWTPAVVAVTEAAEYTATFAQVTNEYTVTWVVEGTVVETDEKVPYGTTPTFNGTTPTKAGNAQYSYTFAGWEPTVSGIVGNVEYTAVFTETVNKYTVTWANDDGSTIKTDSVEYGTMASYSGATPTKDATAQYTFTFDGWDKEFAEVTGDVTYTATYKSTVNKYTVTWVVEGTTVETDENVEYGKTPSYDGAEPTKAGNAQYSYTFDKWTPEVSEVTGDVTYTATFTQSVNKYTITWLDDNDSVIDTTTVAYGDVPTHADPSKAATAQYTYTFTGWDNTPVAVTGDATYKATFKENVREYTITWVVGDNTTTEQYKYNDVPSFKGSTDIPSTESTTYVFTGWDKTIVKVTGDATYTAEYDVTVKTHTITWIVGGQEIKQQWAYGEVPVFEGSTDKAPSATVTYTFAGWDKTPVKVTGDATYTAKYTETPRMYTVVWYVDGEFFATQDVAYNTVIPVPGLPAEKEGYTVKWDNTVTVMPANDVEINAIYTPKMYPVYWIVDGITVYSASVPYGTAIPEKAVPAKDGHSGKWLNVPETMPAGIVMIEAAYTARSYQVFWKIGDAQATETATYGQDLVLTFDVETLPEDLRITVNGAVLSADKYEYDTAAGTLKIYGTAITGNINIIAKSTSGSVNVVSSIFGGTSSNTNSVINMRTAYHTTIKPAAGNLLPKTVMIYVDGILLTDGYSYDPATGKLTINAEVIVGEIEIHAECLEDPNYNPTEHCSCSCHSKNEFIKFFFNIGNFFRKLFGMTQYQYCGCGVAHW